MFDGFEVFFGSTKLASSVSGRRGRRLSFFVVIKLGCGERESIVIGSLVRDVIGRFRVG